GRPGGVGSAALGCSHSAHRLSLIAPRLLRGSAGVPLGFSGGLSLNRAAPVARLRRRPPGILRGTEPESGRACCAAPPASPWDSAGDRCRGGAWAGRPGDDASAAPVFPAALALPLAASPGWSTADTGEIGRTLTALHGRPLDQRLLAISARFLGTPYAHSPLG